MPLLEPLPEQVENALKVALPGDPLSEPPRIAFSTDIRADGTFGEEWLVVTDRNLFVFSPNGKAAADLVHAVPLRQIDGAKAEMLVGNGILELKANGEAVSVLRFSNKVSSSARTAADGINALTRGEDPPEAKAEDERKCARCGRPLPEDSDTCAACVDKKAVLLRLFSFLKPYKLQVAGAIAVLIGISVTELLPPYVAGRIVQALVDSGSRPDKAVRTVVMWVGVLAAARLVSSFLQYFQRRLNSFLGARTLMDIRTALYERLTSLSLSYFDKRALGSIMSRVTNDADNLWDFLMDGLPFVLSNVLTLTGIGIVLFRLDWWLAALLLTPAPFIVLMTVLFLPKVRTRFRNVWHRISSMYSTLNSSLQGMRVIKAFAQEERENERFRHRNRQVFEASFAANAMWAIYMPALNILMAIGSYIIWIGGGYQVAHGTMEIGTLTAFAGYLIAFYAPFQNFTRVLDWATRSVTAAERVFEVLDTEPDVRQAEKAVQVGRLRGEVEFRDVSFGYDRNKRVLEHFDLHVRPGEMIGLVGHSGAGKTTLINLVARFYDVNDGVLLVDGVDVRKIDLHEYRGQLGIVPQEPFLFPGTIRDNIAYAKQDASQEEILRAAKAANCHEFILKFPDGYDSQVGERGQRLSGGERQRISIARALLHDPRILILDEATASVDTETEKQIQEAISRLVEGRTTFAIAHRLSTLRNADRLVVMKEGKVVEVGTHDELMENEGVYHDLVQVQAEINRIRVA
jgi:ATP-binding cassette, subfamily B, bacterial